MRVRRRRERVSTEGREGEKGREGTNLGELHASDHRLPRSDEHVNHRSEEQIEVCLREGVL